MAFSNNIVVLCIGGTVIVLIILILLTWCFCRKYDGQSLSFARPETEINSVTPIHITIQTNGLPHLKRRSQSASSTLDKEELCGETGALLSSPTTPHIHHHDLDMVDDYILIEKIKDIIQTHDLKYESLNEVQATICEELNIYKRDIQLTQRVQKIICDIQKEHEVYLPAALLSPPSAALLFFDDEQDNSNIKPDIWDNKHSNPPWVDQIKCMYQAEMGALLKGYNKQRLFQECDNVQCNQLIQNTNDIYQCPCIQRICIFLKIYQQFYAEINTRFILIQMSDCFVMNEYDFVTLSNDFQHIDKCHMHNNHKMQKFICSQIIEKYKCTCTNCHISNRRSRRNKEKYTSHHALLFPEKLDAIHSYFFHSTLQKGCHHEEDYDKNSNEDKDDEQTSTAQDTAILKHASAYGGKADKVWLQSINDIELTKEHKIYRQLLKSTDVFRWQGTTGFTYNNRGALCHLQPKWKNVKEEALQNMFSAVSIDTWNQMIRTAEEFKKSYNAARIRTKQSGSFTDELFGHTSKWQNGESPCVKEIVVIKLYTDLDTLQSELKKCFRLETRSDLLKRYSMQCIDKKGIHSPLLSQPQTPEWDVSMLHRHRSSTVTVMDETNVMATLEQRLSHFYHWRGNLVIFIHKYSTLLQPRYYDKRKGKELEFILYHGINSKMILNPSTTQSFHGPLSTTSSYYVAESFATNNGMVLSITSQYPRLNNCKAFDASLISDYPEEQEWLIAHIYMRIRKIYIKTLPKCVRVESRIKQAFIAIHLFREQMFSMNRVLEDCIIPFIQIHLFKVMRIEFDSSSYTQIRHKSDGYRYLSNIIKWTKRYEMDIEHTPHIDGILPLTKKDKAKKNRIFYLLTKKFEEFCHVPNRIQTVKIDCVSSGLKPYFFDFVYDENESKHMLDNDESWSVSFEKILNLFPNIEEIHFLNWYRFDNIALNKLIVVIQKQNNNLRQIKFLYFDFKGSLVKHQYFFDPHGLDHDLLNTLKSMDWNISYSKNINPKNGYYIKLKLKQ